MRYVILSVDYEIFGNGSGDVIQHIVKPTTSMAKICRDHGAPLTVFFEAEEYNSFVEYRAELTKDLGYDPAQKIAEQTAALATEGHDFQLHLHPEWVGAKYANRQWQLNREHRAVDHLFDTQEETNRYIASRKKLIEDLAPGRKVTTYRAGAFTAQPGRKLLPALTAAGIFMETSVVKGLHGGPGKLEYRNVPSAKGPWRIQDEVGVESPNGPLWEFPIYSVMGRRLQQLTFGRLRAKFSKNVPKDKQMEMVSQLGIGRNPMQAFRFLFSPVPIKLDFHNVTPGKLLKWIKKAPNAGNPDVVVLIGHTKEHIDDRSFAKLLKGLSADPNLKVIDFTALATLLKTGQASTVNSIDNRVLMA